jgi:hypothetical protein
MLADGSSDLGAAKVIIAIEPRCVGLEHAVVNAGLVLTLHHAFPHQRLRVLAEKAHSDELARLFSESVDSVEFATTVLPARDASRWAVFRARLALIVSEIKKIPPHEPLLVVFLSTDELTIFAVHLAKRYLRRRTYLFQFVIHGELSEMTGWRSRNPIRRLTDLRSSLRLLARGEDQLLVLEEAILEELEREAFWLRDHVRALPLPLLPFEGDNSEHAERLRGEPLRIGFLGLATSGKGYEEYLKLARGAKERLGSSIEFHAFGRLAPEMKGLNQSALARPLGQDRLTRQAYVAGVMGLHFVCLPYQGDHYRWTASGVLVDALAFVKPIITLPQPITMGLFEDYGNVGHLCKSMDDMLTCICALVTRWDEREYKLQKQNLLRARDDRLPQNLAKRYKLLVQIALPELHGQRSEVNGSVGWR